jgi:hypothetical protein
VATEPVPRDATLLPARYHDRAVLRPQEVFDVLGIKPSLGWKLINNGPLERIQLGPRAVGVTCASVERFIIASGVPPAQPPAPSAPQSQSRLVKRPRGAAR